MLILRIFSMAIFVFFFTITLVVTAEVISPWLSIFIGIAVGYGVYRWLKHALARY